MERLKALTATMLLGISIALMIYLASQTVAYRPYLRMQNAIDDALFTWRYLVQGDHGFGADRIVIVDIDDRTTESLGWGRFWPRRHLASVIDSLASAGAKTIFIDMLLLRQGRSGQPRFDYQAFIKTGNMMYRPGGPAADNRIIADAVGRAGNVLLGYYFALDGDGSRLVPGDTIFHEDIAGGWFGDDTSDRTRFLTAQEAVRPFHELVMSARGLGYTNYVPDRDGVIRHIPLYIAHGGLLYPSASLQTWLIVNGFNHTDAVIGRDGISFRDSFIPADTYDIPTDRHSFMRINYVGPGPVYRTVPFLDVLNGDVDPGVFRSRIVMIGSSAERIGDIKRSPCNDRLPGVEIHAAAVNTMVSGRFLRIVPDMAVILLTVLCGIASSLVFSRVPPLGTGLVIALAAPACLYLAEAVMFIWADRLMNIVVPLSVVVIMYFVETVHRFVEQYEEDAGAGELAVNGVEER